MSAACEKCGKIFRDATTLRRHKHRKTPCDPIIQTNTDIKSNYLCRYCGRQFTTPQAQSRHVRHRCKIANSDEGMEKLMDHTLQRQLTEQKAITDALQEQVAELATLLKSQLALLPAAPQIAQVITGPGAAVYNAPVTVINIHPWDGDQRIGIDLAHIIAAFADNTKLREYTRMGDHELVDPEIAPPYVTELLMDLTKRAHADPASRNVYLNPRRADQVLVHKKSGSWEVLPLLEATRLLFDGVAQGIQRVSRNCKEATHLPLEAQNALSMAGLLYDDEPDEYARRAKTPMAAHLENTGPTHAAINHL